MIDYLLDNLNRVFSDPRDARWRRVVGAFCLKYPDVYIDKTRLGTSRVPGGFLVWRKGSDRPPNFSLPYDCRPYDGTSNPAAYTYIVQLVPGGGIAASFEWGRLIKLDKGIYAGDAKSAGDRTVITGFAEFGYDGALGELTPLYSQCFYDMVLPEDRHKYLKQIHQKITIYDPLYYYK